LIIKNKSEYTSTVPESKEITLQYHQKTTEYLRSKIIENNKLKFNNFRKRYKSFAEAASEIEGVINKKKTGMT